MSRLFVKPGWRISCTEAASGAFVGQSTDWHADRAGAVDGSAIGNRPHGILTARALPMAWPWGNRPLDILNAQALPMTWPWGNRPLGILTAQALPMVKSCGNWPHSILTARALPMAQSRFKPPNIASKPQQMPMFHAPAQRMNLRRASTAAAAPPGVSRAQVARSRAAWAGSLPCRTMPA